MKIIQLFDFSLPAIQARTPNEETITGDNPVSSQKEFLIGSAAITFESLESAEMCQQNLNFKAFQERKLFSKLLVPLNLREKSQPGNDDSPQQIQISNNNGEEIFDETIQKELQNVEDFLNSLL